ncbi:hypothetical protein ACIRPH_31240 [Nocardiopsis sp. NPDC101807]|uniref:hypothetical protein n=1 Tax=Nocardiopsis sp. NPDC101807 TaxID=3364339 RepID=UPI00380618B4
MDLHYRWHRILGRLWWHAHAPFEWPLRLPRLYDRVMYGLGLPLGWPRARRGDGLYNLLEPVFGRASGWCVDRALRHYHRATQIADLEG